MTGSATLSPEETQAERQCRQCGLRSYFAQGFEAKFSGWENGLCPRCALEDMRERARVAGEEEQEKLALSALRKTRNLDEAVRLSGLPSPTVRAVRKRALADGRLTPSKPKARAGPGSAPGKSGPQH